METCPWRRKFYLFTVQARSYSESASAFTLRPLPLTLQCLLNQSQGSFGKGKDSTEGQQPASWGWGGTEVPSTSCPAQLTVCLSYPSRGFPWCRLVVNLQTPEPDPVGSFGSTFCSLEPWTGCSFGPLFSLP